MPQDTRNLIERWFDEVWNQNKESTIDELMSPDSVAHGFPDPAGTMGKQQFKLAVRDFHKTFSEINITVEDILVDGDKAATRWSATMVHAGDGLGFPATGQAVHLTGISIARIQEGQIVEAWNALDLTTHVHTLQEIAAKK